MLNKKYRINSSKEYNYLYKKGKKIQGRFMVIFMVENDLNINRFGIVASKKVGNAVKRNRAKRRLREIIRNNRPTRGNGSDCVVVARTNINGAKYALIENEFKHLMKRAGLI